MISFGLPLNIKYISIYPPIVIKLNLLVVSPVYAITGDMALVFLKYTPKNSPLTAV